MENVQRILIFGPTWVGDIVMATANLAAVRETFPVAHIALLLKPGRRGIVDGLGYVDEVIDDRSAESFLSLWKQGRELRKRRFDVALLLPNSLRAALVAWIANIPRRIGYRRDGRAFLLTDVVEYERQAGRRRPMPMPLFYARICARIGVELGDSRTHLAVTPECEEAARDYRSKLGVGDGEELLGLNPGASFGASKLWPPEAFAAAADALHERMGLRTIIFVGPGEEAIGDAIEAAMSTPVVNTARALLPLDVLKPFIRDLRLLISTDTGPRHYAVALGTPVVVVMGPTDPRYSGWNLERSEVVRRDVECGPCHLKVCPLDHRCMRLISSAEVVARAVALERRLGAPSCVQE